MPDEHAALPEPDARAKLEERLVVIRARFIAGLDGRIEELVELAGLVSAAKGAEADAARHALARGLHTIAGTGPTIGLPQLGERARALEAELVDAERDGTSLGLDYIDALMDMRGLAREKTT